MSLHSVIKTSIISVLFIAVSPLFAQSSSGIRKTNDSGKSGLSEYRQRFGAFSMGYHKPFTNGDNFMGLGLEGRSGLDFKVQVYTYKQIIIGYYFGVSFFDVKNKTILGNYEKSRLSEQFFYIGYEFLPLDKVRLGVTASIVGDANFKNRYYPEAENVYQRDHGNLNSYGLYINYEIWRHIMVYFDYSYRTSKTDIAVPSELNALFNKGNYHAFGIGLTYTIGSRDLISRFAD
jgi:hypothetical protein